MHCTKKITSDLVWLGGSDRRLALFENVYPIPRGVSYNAYLIRDEKTALLDTVDQAIAERFFEDLMKACEDTQRSAILAQIDEKLRVWASAGQGILLKTDRDHYLFLFEEQYFQHFVEEKFSILDTIRSIKVAENVHPTLSIGVGMDSPSIPELYKNAKLSLEMALSRGGDQAVIKNRFNFEFYGGRAKETERRD